MSTLVIPEDILLFTDKIKSVTLWININLQYESKKFNLNKIIWNRMQAVICFWKYLPQIQRGVWFMISNFSKERSNIGNRYVTKFIERLPRFSTLKF